MKRRRVTGWLPLVAALVLAVLGPGSLPGFDAGYTRYRLAFRLAVAECHARGTPQCHTGPAG